MTTRSKGIVISVLVVLSPAITSAIDRKPLGEIDFFGYKGFDTAAIRSALPLHEGDLFPPAEMKSSDDLKRQVRDKVKQVIGREPTDVSFVCCDSKQNWMVYIGLPGESYQSLVFHPAPAGDIKFPQEAVALHEEMDRTTMSAVMKGHAAEDDSQGYALSSDPESRKAQLAVREYALQNEALILRVLGSSSDAKHRSMAAQMLGYARQSDEQIHALVEASLDADDGVRNDAVRALMVLATAKPDLAQRIPAEHFVRLLRSGAWSDHNKASFLLLALTRSRDPKVLALLRAEAVDSLLEMARWRNLGHATAALLILGRIAGIDEGSLNQLIASGQVDAIIGKATLQ